MILLTNGCSFTYGGALGLDDEDQKEERLKSVWPYHLSQKLGIDQVVNLAAGCGSNHRIVRTTFNWLSQQTKETLDQTLAVIQWSDPSRYEFYNPIEWKKRKEIKEENWIPVKIGVMQGPREKVWEDLYPASQARFTLFTWVEGDYRNLETHCSLDRIFRYYGVKYFYWSQSFGKKEEYDPTYLKFLYSCCNFVCPIEKQKWFYETVSQTDHHPSLLGHKQIADIIYDGIKSRL